MTQSRLPSTKRTSSPPPLHEQYNEQAARVNNLYRTLQEYSSTYSADFMTYQELCAEYERELQSLNEILARYNKRYGFSAVGGAGHGAGYRR